MFYSNDPEIINKLQQVMHRTGRCIADCNYSLARCRNNVELAIVYLRYNLPQPQPKATTNARRN